MKNGRFVNYTEDAYAHAEYLTGLGKGRFVVLTGDILSDAKRQELLIVFSETIVLKESSGRMRVLAEGRPLAGESCLHRVSALDAGDAGTGRRPL